MGFFWVTVSEILVQVTLSQGLGQNIMVSGVCRERGNLFHSEQETGIEEGTADQAITFKYMAPGTYFLCLDPPPQVSQTFPKGTSGWAPTLEILVSKP